MHRGSLVWFFLALASVSSTLAAAQQGQQSADRQTCIDSDTSIAITPLQQDFFEKWADRQEQATRNRKCLEENLETLRQEAAQRQQFIENNRKTFERILEETRSSLTKIGPVFEFSHTNSAWGYQNSGCLIGGDSVYAYDVAATPSMKVIGTADAGELAEAADLARAVKGHQLELRRRAADAGKQRWTATVGTTKIMLKETGDMVGEVEGDRARKLVNMIGQWCPAAAATLSLWEGLWEALRRPSVVTLGSAQEARALLERAVSELESDRTAALEKFAQVIWKDLSVFCATAAGELVSHPSLLLPGQNVSAFKETWAEKFKTKILEHAIENEISQFSYTDIGFNGSQKVPKGAYITKVGGFICGVGYYK